jgi:hypothetical protein
MDEEQDSGTVLQSNTVAGAKLFIETKTRNYEIPANSGNAMVTALNKVFAVEPDPDHVDLSSLDLDDVFARFRIKSAELNDASFSTYKSRVRRAVMMYTKWLNGENWKESAAARGKNSANGRAARRFERRSAQPDPGADLQRTEAHTDIGLSESAEDGLFDYRVRLVDSGVTAILRLPLTYTSADADRMAALIKALAVSDSISSSRNE